MANLLPANEARKLSEESHTIIVKNNTLKAKETIAALIEKAISTGVHYTHYSFNNYWCNEKEIIEWLESHKYKVKIKKNEVRDKELEITWYHG